MNRNIKFRAWHPDLKEMFYEVRVGTQDWLTKDTHFCGRHDTLMQFTGLKDKNGKEIYEGDIVKHIGIYGDEIKSEVTFGRGMFSPLVYVEEGYNAIDRYHPEEFEVIGNIYENPELLKG